MRRRTESKGYSRTLGVRRSASSRSTPPLRANNCSAPSVGSPTQRHRPSDRSTRALPHNAAARRSGSTSSSASALRRPVSLQQRAGADPSGTRGAQDTCGRPDTPSGHLVRGHGPGLVRADHRRRAERLHRVQVTDQRSLVCHPRRAHGQRERERRQEPLRHERDDDADGEQEAVAGGHIQDERRTEEHDATAHGDRRHESHGPIEVEPQRGGPTHHRTGQPSDPADPAACTGGEHHRERRPRRDVRPREDQRPFAGAVILGRT